MAKQSGLGDQLFIGGYDIGADVSAIGNLSTPRETLPSTGITKSANERLFGKRDGNGEFIAYFNKASSQEHAALKGLPRTDVHLMYLRGTTLGDESIGMVGKQLNYDPTRGDDGSLTFGVNIQANAYGLDWCRQLTAGKKTDTTATNGSSIDTLASAAFGFQAYLQVFSVTGTSVTVTLEDSADNVSFLPITDGAFAAATSGGSPQAQRIQSSSATATVRRYVRAVTSGTFTEAIFAVSICKNEALRVI
jgi:hypothetical protein